MDARKEIRYWIVPLKLVRPTSRSSVCSDAGRKTDIGPLPYPFWGKLALFRKLTAEFAETAEMLDAKYQMPTTNDSFLAANMPEQVRT
jgi:hypothetical protein